MEFVVYVGTAINFFSKHENTIYGFDSFEGFSEDRAGTRSPKGRFNLDKKLPVLNKNVTPVVGWIQDTLVPFLEKHKPEINFVHLDMDTYKTTKFVLTKIKPYFIKNCIITFDEFINFSGWKVGEYKALKEIFKNNEYRYVCFCLDGEQAAI